MSKPRPRIFTSSPEGVVVVDLGMERTGGMVPMYQTKRWDGWMIII
jgi:hypothetical protein